MVAFHIPKPHKQPIWLWVQGTSDTLVDLYLEDLEGLGVLVKLKVSTHPHSNSLPGPIPS